MAEEEEIYDLMNSTTNSSDLPLNDDEMATHWNPVLINNTIFFGIIVFGLAAHILIIYTMAKSKRLRSQTNIIIMNWIIFEMITNNIMYPVEHYFHVHKYSFVLHMILGNIMFVTLNSSFLFLNILISDAIMLSNETSFKKFMERLYGLLLAIIVFVFFWKILTDYSMYLEIVMLIVLILNALVLLIRVIWKQSYRIVKCESLNTNKELRLHVATFFIVSKILTMVLFFISVAYKSSVLMHLAKFWCLSGYYVIPLLIVKDVNFKISLCEVLGLNVKNPSDVDNIIREECDDNFVETCIENP